MNQILHWHEPGFLASSAYPATDDALARLAHAGMTIVINLHEQPHPPDRLRHYGLRQVHLPVRDWTAPTLEQLERGTTEINRALMAGEKLLVHCGAGLGRTGTLIAAYHVRRGLSPREAIKRVREILPGAIETPDQEAAIVAYAELRAKRRGLRLPGRNTP